MWGDLKDVFPMIHIVQNKDAQVVDYKHWQNGIIHWEVIFTRPVHDWELESLQSIFVILYSHKIDRNVEDWMQWVPAPTNHHKQSTPS